MVRLAIVGLGTMGTRLYGLLKDMGVKIEAVCDIDEHRLETFKSQVPRVYRDYRVLAEEGGFDGVVIAVPPRYHVEQAVEFLKRDYYVFLEKPLAHNLDGAKRIYEEARGRGRLFVGYCLRFNKMYQKVKNIVDNVIGPPRFLWHIALGRIPPKSWITDGSISGGVLNEHGSHVIYVFYWYAGPVKRVYANMKYNGLDIERQFTVILEHSSGATSVFTLSWVGGHLWRKWGLDGERGRVVVEDYLRGEYSVSSPDGVVLEHGRVDEDPMDMYREELKHFVEVIERGGRFLVNEEDAFVVSKIVDAAYRSAKEGREVYID